MTKERRIAIIAGVLILIATSAAGVLLLAWAARQAGGPDGLYREDDSVVAYRACQQFVEDNLKVPGSGVWPEDIERDTEPLGEGVFRARSRLVAKNAMGIPVRIDFDCTVRRTESGWELVALKSD